MSEPEEELIGLNRLELECAIRVCRAARDEILVRKFELQERELVHGDGHVREAILACENQVFLITQVVTKLWQLLSQKLADDRKALSDAKKP